MSKKRQKRAHKKAGLSPGTLIYLGEQRTESVEISVFDFDKENLDMRQLATVEDCYPYRDSPTVSWINLNGIHDTSIIESIGSHFKLHPLVMEDILNTTHRPKIDDYNDYLFLVLKMAVLDESSKNVRYEQLSLVIGSNFVISFQEVPGDVFKLVRERLKNAKGRIRKLGSDYLAYALVDAVVDHYFVVLERFEDRIDALDDNILQNPKPKTLKEIHFLKREIMGMRKIVVPLREVVSSLRKTDSSIVQEQTVLFLHDLNDHLLQVIDALEGTRDSLSNMADLYMSAVSNKMNEVMKTLTIIASIFIPLTFIAGIYGMNFEHMPELKWQFGYPLVWIVMLSVCIGLIAFFRRKRWF